MTLEAVLAEFWAQVERHDMLDVMAEDVARLGLFDAQLKCECGRDLTPEGDCRECSRLASVTFERVWSTR